jgi:hypothetical protein
MHMHLYSLIEYKIQNDHRVKFQFRCYGPIILARLLNVSVSRPVPISNTNKIVTFLCCKCNSPVSLSKHNGNYIFHILQH